METTATAKTAKTSSKYSWTFSEEAKLRKIVNQLQQSDPVKYERIDELSPFWTEVANQHKNGRSAAACLARWMTKVGGDITHGNWTETEDQTLLDMYSSETFNSWSKRVIELGKKFHGGKRRGGAEVCNRYMLLTKKKGKKDVDVKKNTSKSNVVAGKKKSK